MTVHVDEIIAHRYAEVSEDWSAHDFEIDVARATRRFASPTPLGADLTVTAYQIADDMFAFEATCDAASSSTF